MGDDTSTTLTPGRARDVGRTMRRGAAAVRGSSFARLDVPDQSFSPLPRGVELAGEHATSYHILSRTLEGFELDLDDYGDAVVRCADGLENTDRDSATLLSRLARVVPGGQDRRYAADAWRDPR